MSELNCNSTSSKNILTRAACPDETPVNYLELLASGEPHQAAMAIYLKHSDELLSRAKHYLGTDYRAHAHDLVLDAMLKVAEFMESGEKDDSFNWEIWFFAKLRYMARDLIDKEGRCSALPINEKGEELEFASDDVRAVTAGTSSESPEESLERLHEKEHARHINQILDSKYHDILNSLRGRKRALFEELHGNGGSLATYMEKNPDVSKRNADKIRCELDQRLRQTLLAELDFENFKDELTPKPQAPASPRRRVAGVQSNLRNSLTLQPV